MKQYPIKLEVMISDDMANWLSILETKYYKKKSHFVRQAIIEKLNRDMPKLRLESNKSDIPF